MRSETKYIFITGGVVSSLGKGLASAALGALLQLALFGDVDDHQDPAAIDQRPLRDTDPAPVEKFQSS